MEIFNSQSFLKLRIFFKLIKQHEEYDYHIFFLHVHVLFDLKIINIHMYVNEHNWFRQQALYISMLSLFILTCKSLFLVYEYYELF